MFYSTVGPCQSIFEKIGLQADKVEGKQSYTDWRTPFYQYFTRSFFADCPRPKNYKIQLFASPKWEFKPSDFL